MKIYTIKSISPPHPLYLSQFSTKLDMVNCAGVPQFRQIYWWEGRVVWRRGGRKETWSYWSWSTFY